MIIVGSATPTISRGCPPRIACIIPHIAVDARVSTVLRIPSETDHFVLVRDWVAFKLMYCIVVIRRASIHLFRCSAALRRR